MQWVPSCSMQESKVKNGYLVDQGKKRVPSGRRQATGTQFSSQRRVPSGPRKAINTQLSDVERGYLVIQGRKWVPSGAKGKM